MSTLAPHAAISSISSKRDGVEPPGVGHDARVGGEDAVDVGVDLADVGVQRGGQRDGGGVRPAAAQRGDVLAVLADALEAGDQHDQALVERVLQPAGRDVDDLGVAVRAGGDHAGLRPGERAGLRRRASGWPSRPARWRCAHPRSAACPSRAPAGPGTPAGQVEQVVGGVAHRGDHDDDVVALPSWSRRCARRRGGSARRQTPRIRRTSARRAPLSDLSGAVRDPTKDKGSAHLIYSAGSVRMWSRSASARETD